MSLPRFTEPVPLCVKLLQVTEDAGLVAFNERRPEFSIVIPPPERPARVTAAAFSFP